MGVEPGEWSIEEYVTPGGENLVLAFLSGLTGRARTEAMALLRLLKERGNTLGMPRSKPLAGGLCELRGHQVRMFYMFRPGRRITLLDGMVKKQDHIPPRVLARVRRFQREVEAMDAESARGS